jgi:hypothetical protein
MAISFEEALALPRASYITLRSSGIKKENVIGVEGDTLVRVHPSKKRSIPYTHHFATCMVIAVENTRTGVMAVAHLPENRREALKAMIPLVREPGSDDPLEVHFIGANYNPKFERDIQRWNDEMRGMVQIVNDTPGATLVTFDVGHKPHPDEVAFFKDEVGKTCIARGRGYYKDNEEVVTEPNPHFPDVPMPGAPKGYMPTPDNPFHISWDSMSRNPEVKKASAHNRVANTWKR